ncbi:MAG TPA: hypothetical protein VI670_10145 [Thermoanaerobaculia bacterium]
MKLLLDTQILLWVAGHPERLPEAACLLLSSRKNELFFSAASIWEVSSAHAIRVASLPQLHREIHSIAFCCSGAHGGYDLDHRRRPTG